MTLPAPFKIQIANSKQKKDALGDEILLEIWPAAARVKAKAVVARNLSEVNCVLA